MIGITEDFVFFEAFNIPAKVNLINFKIWHSHRPQVNEHTLIKKKNTSTEDKLVIRLGIVYRQDKDTSLVAKSR